MYEAVAPRCGSLVHVTACLDTHALRSGVFVSLRRTRALTQPWANRNRLHAGQLMQLLNVHVCTVSIEAHSLEQIQDALTGTNTAHVFTLNSYFT